MKWEAFVLAGQLGDVATTLLGRWLGIVEGNPWMARLLAGGEWDYLAVKVTLALVVAGLLWRVRRRSLWPARVVALGMAAVVASNLSQIVGA